MIGSISCPSIPRLSRLWTVTGIRKDFFFFGGCGAWGSAPALIALWRRGTPHGHVSDFDWRRGLVSNENLLRFPLLFKAKLFDFCLPFLTSSSSLYDWFF